jgi:hypothetical protein
VITIAGVALPDKQLTRRTSSPGFAKPWRTAVKPTIGRIVHYLRNDGLGREEPYAALISEEPQPYCWSWPKEEP